MRRGVEIANSIGKHANRYHIFLLKENVKLMKVTFTTEQSWGDLREWHAAPDLTIEIADGRNQNISALDWRNQDGSTGSIAFQSDLSTFLGYYEKPNEGPIAYRGRRK